MAAHGIDEALGTGYAEVGTLCIVTTQVDLLRKQSHNTCRDHQEQDGPRKEEKESRRTPSTLSTGCIGTLGRTPPFLPSSLTL
jgi:hypothetical protein